MSGHGAVWIAAVIWMTACGNGAPLLTELADSGGISMADSAAPAIDAEDSSGGLDRGRYLVRHVLACGECHTPRLPDGTADETRFLAGRACLHVEMATDGGASCVNAPNLTSHETGIGRYDDPELRAMIFDGVRPDARVLGATYMPYFVYAAATARDADAIVMYLRSLPPTENALPGRDPASTSAGQLARAEKIDASNLPAPGPVNDAETLRALANGRYLAALACVGCHTPFVQPGDRAATRPIDLQRALAGGRPFSTDRGPLFSANLTPDATGLRGWSSLDIARAVRDGIDRGGQTLCGPMPAAAFSGLTTTDAADLAAYLQSIPPITNPVERRCTSR